MNSLSSVHIFCKLQIDAGIHVKSESFILFLFACFSFFLCVILRGKKDRGLKICHDQYLLPTLVRKLKAIKFLRFKDLHSRCMQRLHQCTSLKGCFEPPTYYEMEVSHFVSSETLKTCFEKPNLV